MVKTFKRIEGSARLHVFHHSLLVAVCNADGNVFNTSVLTPCAVAFHNGSSQHVAEEASLQFAGNIVEKNSARSHMCTSMREEMSLWTPLRTTTWQCVTRSLWSHLTIISIRACSCQGQVVAAWSERLQRAEAPPVPLLEDAGG